jgi:dTDP-4-amino-4,6-dideoxygalactose transaminase
VPEWAEPVWHLFVVRHPKRNALIQRLNKAGVGTVIHYLTPPHLQNAYAVEGFSPNAFSLATAIAKEIMSLPIGPQFSLESAKYVTGFCSKL